ncbi:MAG: 30S ribosomal protein S20 [Patescibacteria group bacterium]|nr:30S ribosomal protein S20 [Patescibacteria group bacterium]
MAIIKSAKKAIRQNKRHRALNLKRQAEFKAVIKKYKALLKEKNKDEAKKYFSQLQKKVDKLAKVGFIKNNKARRLKSRLSRQIK